VLPLDFLFAQDKWLHSPQHNYNKVMVQSESQAHQEHRQLPQTQVAAPGPPENLQNSKINTQVAHRECPGIICLKVQKDSGRNSNQTRYYLILISTAIKK
jgi:hypothetical protein